VCDDVSVVSVNHYQIGLLDNQICLIDYQIKYLLLRLMSDDVGQR